MKHEIFKNQEYIIGEISEIYQEESIFPFCEQIFQQQGQCIIK